MAGPRACAHRRRVARKQRAARSARYAAACPPPPFPCRRWQRPVWRSFRFRTSDYTKLTIDYRVLPKSAGQPWAGRGGRGGEAGDTTKTWRRRGRLTRTGSGQDATGSGQDPVGGRGPGRGRQTCPDAAGHGRRTRPRRLRAQTRASMWRDDPATREALVVTLRDVRVGAAGADGPAICALTAL
jgi:hypothetical protein